jgi:hypothetical protein
MLILAVAIFAQRVDFHSGQGDGAYLPELCGTEIATLQSQYPEFFLQRTD